MKRVKILVICKSIDYVTSECLEWGAVLKEHLSKGVKCLVPDRRIETPYAIIDFVCDDDLNTGRYKVVVQQGEDEEKVLQLAIGEAKRIHV